MIKTLRGWAAAAVLALAVTAGGCAGMGVEDVLSGRDTYSRGSNVTGQVRAVGSRTIELRMENGRTARVRYDRSTDVRYGDRRYSVRSLERGDWVTIRTHRDRGGDLVARTVEVRRNVRADRGNDRRTERRAPPRRSEAYARTSVEGRVGRVDRRGGTRFELHGTREGTVVVTVPGNASANLRRHIRRLREGDRVELRGRFLSERRFEIEGFR